MSHDQVGQKSRHHQYVDVYQLPKPQEQRRRWIDPLTFSEIIEPGWCVSKSLVFGPFFLPVYFQVVNSCSVYGLPSGICWNRMGNWRGCLEQESSATSECNDAACDQQYMDYHGLPWHHATRFAWFFSYQKWTMGARP